MHHAAQRSWERERLFEALEAFTQGVGDPPLMHKWRDAGRQAANDGQQQPMAFVLSTDEVDRYGDVIEADGWKLASYRNNPVLLWAHDYTRPVIGRAVDTWTESHRLLAKMEFASTPFAQEVAGLYQGGYQRGVSVGFRPLRYEERRHEKTGALLGLRFLEQELLEVSAVPVPANRNALKRALDEAPRVGEYLRRTIAVPSNGTGNGTVADGAALEATWPVLSARVDDLAKLAHELAQMVTDMGLNDHSALERPSDESSVTDLLSLLREAHR